MSYSNCRGGGQRLKRFTDMPVAAMCSQWYSSHRLGPSLQSVTARIEPWCCLKYFNVNISRQGTSLTETSLYTYGNHYDSSRSIWERSPFLSHLSRLRLTGTKIIFVIFSPYHAWMRVQLRLTFIPRKTLMKLATHDCSSFHMLQAFAPWYPWANC